MLPKGCQMLLFSATFEDSVWKFAERVVPDPNIIKLKREEETLDTIKQYYVQCNSKEDKFNALCNIYGAITIAQAMIFCHVSLFASGGYFCVVLLLSLNHFMLSSFLRLEKQPTGLPASCLKRATRWRSSVGKWWLSREQLLLNVSEMARRKFSSLLMSVQEACTLLNIHLIRCKAVFLHP